MSLHFLHKMCLDFGGAVHLDVLEIKVRNTEKVIDKKIPIFFYKKIDEEKNLIRQEIKMELIKFIGNKDVNKFLIN